MTQSFFILSGLWCLYLLGRDIPLQETVKLSKHHPHSQTNRWCFHIPIFIFVGVGLKDGAEIHPFNGVHHCLLTMLNNQVKEGMRHVARLFRLLKEQLRTYTNWFGNKLLRKQFVSILG